MSKKTHLYIYSKNRLSGSNSSSDFSIRLLNPLDDIKKIRLLNVLIPNTVYNINSNNNTFLWEESAGGGQISSTLTNGSYSAQTFATMLKTVMDADSNNSQSYTISYNIDTGKYTISSSANFSLYFSQMNSTIAKMMGFASTSDQTGSSSYTSTNVCNFSFSDFISIKITQFEDNMKKNIYGGSIYYDHTFIIPNNTNFSDIISYHNDVDDENEIVFNISKSFKFLNISLRDENNNILDLNGNDWWFSLLCES